jgi:excisionase family DNA binding protein
MNESIRLQFEVVLTPNTIERIAQLLTPPQSPEKKRLESSRRAIYAGEEPPEDESMLLDTKQVAKQLKVSDRTVFAMHTSGEMPKAVRIGRAVRWGRAEIKAWVDEGCPPASEWKWPK